VPSELKRRRCPTCYRKSLLSAPGERCGDWTLIEHHGYSRLVMALSTLRVQVKTGFGCCIGCVRRLKLWHRLQGLAKLAEKLGARAAFQAMEWATVEDLTCFVDVEPRPSFNATYELWDAASTPRQREQS
jgi:hypothetical protein